MLYINHINCCDLMTNIHCTYLLPKYLLQLESGSSLFTHSFTVKQRNINTSNNNND